MAEEEDSSAAICVLHVTNFSDTNYGNLVWTLQNKFVLSRV